MRRSNPKTRIVPALVRIEIVGLYFEGTKIPWTALNYRLEKGKSLRFALVPMPNGRYEVRVKITKPKV